MSICPRRTKSLRIQKEVTTLSDDLGPRESEAITKLLDLAKFAILAMLVAGGFMGANTLI